MSNKLPEKISLMGRTTTIKEVEKDLLKSLFPDDQDTLAYYQESEDTIYLLRTLPLHVKQRVLLHELTHVIVSVSGIKHSLKKGQEEQICDLAESLLPLFKDEAFRAYMKGNE